MEERVEDYIKRIENIIQTLSEHIEFEDYDEDVLKEASEDKEAIENLLKRYKDLVETSIRLSKECVELEEENKKLKVQCENEFKRGFFMKVAENYEKTNAEIINVPNLYVPKSVIQNKLEQNKAKTDCRYCNNSCDSYAVCTVLKEILEKGNK